MCWPLQDGLDDKEEADDNAARPTEATQPGQAPNRENVVVSDVTPLSLGVKIANDEMDIVTPRNSTIPFSKVKEYMTWKDNQDRLVFDTRQG
mmetsp:Transcript_23898/g.32029  ORF Transcript_23898/g.32029 Transcript_23898/m.32029 type:complete len:92 (+) Transcript_23898:325-600(+)